MYCEQCGQVICLDELKEVLLDKDGKVVWHSKCDKKRDKPSKTEEVRDK